MGHDAKRWSKRPPFDFSAVRTTSVTSKQFQDRVKTVVSGPDYESTAGVLLTLCIDYKSD